MIAANPAGFAIITGEESIIGYVRQSCFQQETPPAEDAAADQTPSEEKKLFDREEGGCAVDLDCDDEKSM